MAVIVSQGFASLLLLTQGYSSSVVIHNGGGPPCFGLHAPGTSVCLGSAFTNDLGYDGPLTYDGVGTYDDDIYTLTAIAFTPPPNLTP